MSNERTRNGLELLSDGRGVFGLGFRRRCEAIPNPLIIRPDKFILHNSNLALQQVPLKLPGLFKHSAERSLAHRLHLILYEQSARLDGFDLGVPGELRECEHLRKKFYGCQAKAYRITNALIRRLLAETGDERALRVARRFRFRSRQQIYYLASRSDRLSQLCETFPLLAAVLSYELLTPSSDPRFSAQDVVKAVHAGQPLRHVAALVGLPYVMKAVPPLAINGAVPFHKMFRCNPHLIHRMPRTGRAANAWFDVLDKAHAVSPDFAVWCAKRIEIAPPYGRAAVEVSNIGDWVRASYEKHVQAEIDDLARRLEAEVPAEVVRERLNGHRFPTGTGSSLVTRTFKPDMSARTVYQLSEEWHDAVANQRFSGNTAPFPKAWAPRSTIDGYEITPIETPQDLYLEGKAMRNCVATYDGHVRAGRSCLFNMRDGNEPIATIEMQSAPDGFHLAQFAGPCNQPVGKSVERIIRKWVRRTKFVRETPPLPAGMEYLPTGDAGNLDDEIPF